jgi:predicted NBD/HSP70 family sugar kinase
VTLWELIWAVSEVADDEREVIATVAHMLTSGSVRVVGGVRDRRIRFA